MDRVSIFTVLMLTAINLIVVSVALPAIMGRGVSRAARLAQGSLLAQALGWITILASGFWVGHWMDLVLSTVCMALACLAQVLMFQALAQWLGPRPGQRLMLGLAVLMPLGYAATFADYSLRVGWSNLLLAAQMLLVARAALWPQHDARRHWRWLLAGSHATVAAFTLARGVMGAFMPELYPRFLAPHPVNIAAQVVTNTFMCLVPIRILVAWRDEAEARLRAHARTDGLTGLLNRRGWDAGAAAALATAQRHGHALAVLLLDLDHFKRVNDQHGHEAGDRALRLLAEVLGACVREGDLTARLGGEEFAVLLPHGDNRAAAALDRRLRRQLALRAPMELGFELGYSSGSAEREPDERDASALLARADEALYRAKGAGRGRLVTAGT